MNKVSSIKGKIYYRGVDIGRVNATFLYDETLFNSLKILFYSLFFRMKVEKIISGRNLSLFVYQDYDAKHLKEIIELTNNNRTINTSKTVLKTKLSLLSPIIILKVKKYWSQLNEIEDLKFESLFRKFVISLLLSRTTIDVDTAYESGLPKRTLLTLCDAQPYENIYAQIGNYIGLDTYTHQHGQYRILKGCNISPDVELYDNFVSGKMLCWGEATIDEFAKVNICRDRFIKFGKIINRIEINKKNNETKIIGIILNGENGKESNFNMIEYINTQGCKYIVRMHPKNKIKDYKSIINENCLYISKFNDFEFFNHVDISICHMTGVAMNALAYKENICFFDDRLLPEVFNVDGIVINKKTNILTFESDCNKDKILEYFICESDMGHTLKKIFFKGDM